MRGMRDGEIISVVIAGVVGLVVGTVCAAFYVENAWKHQIVHHGAAVWIIDPKTGEVEFKWLKCEREPTTAKGEGE